MKLKVLAMLPYVLQLNPRAWSWTIRLYCLRITVAAKLSWSSKKKTDQIPEGKHDIDLSYHL